MLKRTSLLCVVLFIGYLPHSLALTLEDALVHVYQEHPALNAQREALKAENENASAAFSGWLPSLNIQYERGQQKTGSFGNQSTESKGIYASQPLFKGGKTLHEMKEADAKIDAKRAELLDLEQRLFLETITRYLDILQLEQQLKLSHKEYQVMESHLQATLEGFKLGQKTKTDIAQSEASLAKALASQITIDSDLDAARANFKNLVALDDSHVVFPEKEFTIESSLEELAAEALENHPKRLLSRYQLKTAQQSVGVARAALFPQAALNASKTEQKGNIFSGGRTIESDSISLGIDIPLFQSGSEYSKIRQAKHAAKEKEIDERNVAKTIRQELVDAYYLFHNAAAKLVAQESIKKATAAALEGTKIEASIGARSTLDLLEAEQEHFAAQSELITLRREKILHYYNVKAATGALHSSALALDVTPYDLEAHRQKVQRKFIGF